MERQPKASICNNNETDEDYSGTVASLCENWRVIECKGCIQWILKRRKSRLGQCWKAKGYYLTRTSLIKASTASCGWIDPAAIAMLFALPERFGGAV